MSRTDAAECAILPDAPERCTILSRITPCNVVNGKAVDWAGARRNLIDPCTGAVVGVAPVSGAAEVDEAMAAAAAAFQGWRFTLPAVRQRALLRLADLLEQRIDEFAAAEIRDTGSAQAGAETPLMVDQIRFFAGAARMLDGLSAGEYVDEHTSYVRREPIGVCAQLAPWNFPLLMAVLKAAPAIAAGNTVVLKPAPTTPSTAVMFAEMAAEVLPPGVLNVICGDDETGRLMVAHPTPAMVSITGSIAAGIEVARSAADDLKRVHLELGGKTPVVVCADAELEEAAKGILTGAFANAGQDCTAASRVLAHSAIYDDLVERLVTGARASRPGPPDDVGATYGPLNNVDQLGHVLGLVQRLPEHATIQTGGGRHGDAGYFIEPTVITDVRQDDEICQTEVFGPVITVQPFDDDEQAIRMANDVEHGLTAGLWTGSNARAMRLSRLFDSGTVWINTHLGFPTEMPHGGCKHSGYGKDLSKFGFDDYTRVKHVMHKF